MKKNKKMLFILCVGLLVSCGAFGSGKELSKNQIMSFIKKIDTTNNYNYSTDECTLLSYKVDASEEYLKKVGQTQEEFYESNYSELQFYDFKSQSYYHPQIGVKHLDEISNVRQYDPANLDVISTQIDEYLSSGYKFYLENDCLVEVIPMGSPTSSSYDGYERYLGEIDMLWTSEAVFVDTSFYTQTEFIKIEQNETESIVLFGRTRGYRGDIEYLLKINEETNKIEKFDIISHHETPGYFGNEEELKVEEYLNGYDLESDDVDLDYVAGSTAKITILALEEGINDAIKAYKENKENIVWEHALEEKQEYIIEMHIDKEGLISVFNESKKVDVYQRGVWCYSIELETHTKLFDHKWVDEEIS